VLTGVAGWPVGQSRSPAMHNAAYAALGLEGWRYTRLPLEPERFTETVRALPASGYRGINVTIPHKEAALALADGASAVAQAIGAANTLTFEDGRIQADNTDAQGFLDAIAEPLHGKEVLILGAGGSARAVAWAARESGARVRVWNRTTERAEALARDLGVESVVSASGADVVVNATAAGLTGSANELPLADLGNPGTVVDLVYGSDVPPVTAWANQLGTRLVDGLEILVRQGALSFVRWTGEDPPLQVMREAVRPCSEAPGMRVRFRY
jgi:shikimate dehydrogenase